MRLKMFMFVRQSVYVALRLLWDKGLRIKIQTPTFYPNYKHSVFHMDMSYMCCYSAYLKMELG